MLNMPKRQSKQETDYKGIALVIIALAIFYVLVYHFLALVIVGSLSIIFVIAVVIVGAYFILPAIGIEGIAGLAALIGLGRSRK